MSPSETPKLEFSGAPEDPGASCVDENWLVSDESRAALAGLLMPGIVFVLSAARTASGNARVPSSMPSQSREPPP